MKRPHLGLLMVLKNFLPSYQSHKDLQPPAFRLQGGLKWKRVLEYPAAVFLPDDELSELQTRTRIQPDRGLRFSAQVRCGCGPSASGARSRSLCGKLASADACILPRFSTSLALLLPA